MPTAASLPTSIDGLVDSVMVNVALKVSDNRSPAARRSAVGPPWTESRISSSVSIAREVSSALTPSGTRGQSGHRRRQFGEEPSIEVIL